MRKFGLIGYPLVHSFSKKYFDAKFESGNIRGCSYNNFPLKNIDEFPGLISDNPELCGLNVTIPYKTEILKYVIETEDAVKEIGAVNVLKIRREGVKTKIRGYNSDVAGIRNSILPVFGGKAGNALVLGTGGASKAVAWTLNKMGFKILMVSRNKKEGVMCYNEINSGILNNTDLIVNATPLGMFPDISLKPDIDYNLLNEKHTLFDLVYNPELTQFLKMGKERGCRIITGLKMLYAQADRSWEIWNDSSL